MLSRMSARDRRALAVGALVVASAVLVTRGVPWYRGWHEASLTSAREMVAESQRAWNAVSNAQAISDTMQARSERFVQVAPTLLDGASAAAASATLASLVSGAAAASEARIGSVQVRPRTAADSSGSAHRAFQRVAVRATLTADVRGLAQMLLALESGQTLLSIEELSVTQPEPAADNTRAEALQVEIVVSGLAHVKEKGR
jgi:hypothetical protein